MKWPMLTMLVALALTISGRGRCTVHAADMQSAPAPTTTLRMRGIVQKYDAARRILSLMTPSGTFRIQVGPAIRLRQGRVNIDAAALEKLKGYRVAVRYSEIAGSRTAESIHVFGRDDRTSP